VVSFLIASGSLINVKNSFKQLPLEEAKTPEITKMIEDCLSDPLKILLQELSKKPNFNKVSEIYLRNGLNQEVIAFRVELKDERMKEYKHNWTRVWH
jgi:hypothetical protein